MVSGECAICGLELGGSPQNSKGQVLQGYMTHLRYSHGKSVKNLVKEDLSDMSDEEILDLPDI